MSVELPPHSEIVAMVVHKQKVWIATKIGVFELDEMAIPPTLTEIITVPPLPGRGAGSN